MGTIRHDFNEPSERFTRLANDWLRDSRLSLGAIGLLSHLHSHKAGFSVDMEALARRFNTGIRALRTYRRELEKHGYLRLVLPERADGTRGAYEWVLTEPAIHSDGSARVENATSGEPPHLKKTTQKEDQEQEDLNGPAGARSASRAQRDYLRDLHAHGGGKASPGVTEWIDGLTVAQADAEIREALSALPRGRGYLGDPNSPDLSEKGREVAARRLLPPTIREEEASDVRR